MIVMITATVASCVYTRDRIGPGSLATSLVLGDALVILAHPDDETWLSGTLALIAAAGKRVIVVYATSGDKGTDRSGRNLTAQDLAHAREGEARAALQSLGINQSPIFLDMGDGTLSDNPSELLNRLQEKCDLASVELVFTFGKTGITGHPDHIALGEVVENWLQNRADRQSRPRLLRAVVSQGRADVAEQVAITLQHPYRIGAPSPDQEVRLSLDVSALQQQRLAAFGQHKTQFPASMEVLWQEFVAKSTLEEFSY